MAQQYTLKKIGDNQFEYINSKGERHTLTKEKIDAFVKQGKEFIIDGKKYPSNESASQPISKNNFTTNDEVNFEFKDKVYPRAIIIKNLIKGANLTVNNRPVKLNATQNDFEYADVQQSVVPSNPQPKLYNFTTTDDQNFTIDGKTVDRATVHKNLKKGIKITINQHEAKLTSDGNDFTYSSSELNSTKQYKTTQENAIGMLAAAPTNAVPLVVLEVKSSPDGNYIFKGKTYTKQTILNTLLHGKNVSIDGKLVELDDDRDGFHFVKQPEPVPQPTEAIKKTIDLRKIDNNSFYYEKLKATLSRPTIVKNLKKGVKISIDGKSIALTPNGLDFDYVDEVEKMFKNARPISEIKKELEASSASVINTGKELPTYFKVDDKLAEEENKINSSIKESNSFKKMKELQKRLFYLSADSNMINVNADKQFSTFDLGRFVNDFEAANNNYKDTFRKLLSGTPIVFDFKKSTPANEKLWNLLLKFNSKVQDTFKEMGEDYLEVGYPAVSDVIVEQGAGNDNLIYINSPLFLAKSNLLINTKQKTATIIITQEKQQIAYRPNKELLLYLTTKLDKQVNLSKYAELFDDGFRTVEEQVQAMGRFFKDLGIMFDENKLMDILDKLSYSEFKYTTSNLDNDDPDKSKNKKLKTSKKEEMVLPAKGQSQQAPAPNKNGPEGLNIIDNCFMGVFKTLNSEIFKDYDKILEQPEGIEYWNELNSLVPDQLKYYKNKGKDFQEKDIRQIVELDYSQKVACKLALTNSINIVGPAGTGKSQTISNILANFIDRNESTLFVAEKKTATDVVFNRLKNLRFYCLPLFDKENWNEALTKQIRMTLKRVGSIYGSWDALELDSPEIQESHATDNLDAYFSKIKDFRTLMSSNKGYSAPKSKIEFSSQKSKKMLDDIDRLVKTIFEASDNSKDFWDRIKQTQAEKPLYKGCMAILNALDDEELKNSVELQNRFLKICKYYDSPTLLRNEMVQILQATDYNDKEITPIDFPNKNALESYVQTDNLYKKYLRNIQAVIAAHSSTLALMKKQKGFMTVESLKALGTKVGMHEQTAQQQQFGPYQQQNFGYNQNYIQPQQTVQQNVQLINGIPMVQLPNGQWVPQQQQFNPQQLNPQYQQQPQQPQQQVVQPGVAQGAQLLSQMMTAPVQQNRFDNPVDEFVSLYNEDNFNFEEIKKFVSLQSWWKEHSELQLDTAKEFNQATEDLDNKIAMDLTFSELDFLRYIKNKIENTPAYADQYNQLYGIVDNTTKLENVEWVLQTFNQIITLLFPIVIASPNLVCKYIDPRRGTFKHIVIDEASMLSLEKAIPILYRGQSYCIVGDGKQLQPLSYLEQLRKLETLTKLHLDGKIKKADLVKQQKLINEYKGVLDFMAPHIQKTTLQYHYRAIKTELVKFSSVAFYDNEMITSDNYKSPQEYIDSGLQVKQINGDYKKGINEKECHALYDQLVQIARMNKNIIQVAKKISVGIIVFSNAQKNYLENLINQEADPDVLNMELMLNQETGEDNSLFIKDVESVQGDERDVILMSLGSSSKNKAEIVQSFGLLNTNLGPNFLNVMTTRARKKLIIFKSFTAEDVPSTGNTAINYYRDFIKYIDLLSRKDDERTANEIDNLFKEYLLRSGTIDYSTLQFNQNKSYLSKLVFNKFNEHIDHSKFKVVKAISPIQGQTFDLVGYDRKTNIPTFALIFDEFLKNIYKTVKQAEFYDYLFLKGRGWNFNKVTSMEWSVQVSKAIDESIINEFIKKKLTFGTECYYVEKDASHLEIEEQEEAARKEREQQYLQQPSLSFLNDSENQKTSKKVTKKSAEKPATAIKKESITSKQSKSKNILQKQAKQKAVKKAVKKVSKKPTKKNKK